eukprot:2083085-Prymnesium_polylepis.1
MRLACLRVVRDAHAKREPQPQACDAPAPTPTLHAPSFVWCVRPALAQAQNPSIEMSPACA